LIFNIAIVDSVGSNSDGNSDGISLENVKEVRFYNNDPALPVYRWGLLNGLATDDVAAILLKEQIHLTKIATRVPTCISKNTAFVVDSTKIRSSEDIRYVMIWGRGLTQDQKYFPITLMRMEKSIEGMIRKIIKNINLPVNFLKTRAYRHCER
jgi:hypothetical protein